MSQYNITDKKICKVRINRIKYICNGDNLMEKKKYGEDINLEFVYTKIFNEIWNGYNLTDKDKKAFEKKVKDYEKNNSDPSNPLGDIIQGTGGAIKIRFNSSTDNVGKSGSYRIIYCKYGRRVYAMILIYKKSDKASLNDKEKSMIKNRIRELKDKQ